MSAPFNAPSILQSAGVEPERAGAILGEALMGADDGELFIERSESEAFVFDDGRLKSASYDSSEPVNLGTGEEISIRDLAALIAEKTGFRGRLRWDPTQPNGQPRRRLEVSRARARFGFVAETSFADGLAATIAYFEEQHRKGLL